MEQNKEEYETVYYVTAPYANSEEEVSTSFVVQDGDNITEEQIIVLNEDGSIMINEDGSFVDGKTFVEAEVFENVVIKHENDSLPNELNATQEGTEISNSEDTVMEHESTMEQDATSALDNEGSSVVEESSIVKIEDNSIVGPDSSIIEPDSSFVENDSSFVENDSSIVEYDNSIVEHEDSSIVEDDGSPIVEHLMSISESGANTAMEHDDSTLSCDAAKEGSFDPLKPLLKAVGSACAIPEGVVDKLTCRYCMKSFSKTGNKARHIRQVHKIKKQIGSHIRCIECNTCYKHVNKLRDHLKAFHRLNMAEEELCFPNMNAFKKWKHEIERKEMTSFTLRHGARKTINGQKFFYVCHRSGKYSSRVIGPRQRMLKNPGTCKLGIVCTAAIYCEERPNDVLVKYCPHHYGHGKETAFVQLSTEEQTAIQENISNGIPFENLLDDIRDSQSATDHFQLHFLKKKDIRFINNAFITDEYNPGLSDAESVDQWVRMCCQMDDSPVLFYRQEEFANSEEDFMLIIMTEFQKQILMASARQVVCVDSLYRRKGGRFYLTVLFIMDEFDIAFPVAFCISNKVDKQVIVQFLTSIKESTGPLSCTFFMSDSEKFYYESWVEVMGDESAQWLWSMWYVDNRIRVQLRIFKGNIVKRAEAYKTMRQLLECQNQNVFNTMFKNYMDSLMSDPQSKTLGTFIHQKYGSNPEMWAYCYRKDIKLSTNIHLEVMHRTFRYCCREGRKKRLDKFIFVIMKLVRYKMLNRLANMLDEEKIGLAIEAINMCHGVGLEIPSEHISSLSDKIWLIRSDEEDSVYVTREFDACPEHCSLRCSECDICVHMYSCSCLHSMINANLCQHIHAVVWKFLTPHFSPAASPARDDCDEMEDIDLTIPDNCSELLDGVLKRSHDVYKKVRENKCNLKKDCLTAIMKRLNECVDICNGKALKEVEPPLPKSNPVYVINSYGKGDSAQPLILQNLPAILPNAEQSQSQYVMILPKNSK